MSGTVHGAIDAQVGISIPSKEASEVLFTTLFNFLNTLTGSEIITRIAYNTGSVGSGTDYYDDPNPWGKNAWYLYRWNTSSVRTWEWYMLVQHTSQSGNFGDSPGNPGLLNASAELQSGNEGSIGIATATLITTGGQSLSPWNGTTNNNGEDSKGTPVWESGSNTDILSVLPRSNNTGGSHNTNRENMAEFYNGVTTGLSSRFHFMCDDDAMVSFVSTTNNGLYACNYWGYYQPRNELTSSNFTPMCMLINDSDAVNQLAGNENCGTTTGNATAYEGGVVISGSVVIGRIGQYDSTWMKDVNLQPNTTLPIPAHDIFAVPLHAYESPAFGNVGYLVGQLYSETYAVTSHDINATGNRVVFGESSTVNSVKIWTTWDSGSAAPGTGTSRTGSIF